MSRQGYDEEAKVEKILIIYFMALHNIYSLVPQPRGWDLREPTGVERGSPRCGKDGRVG